MSKKEVSELIKLKENRILIKKFGKVEKTTGGIILPEENQEAPEGGVIVAVGPTAVAVTVGQNVRYMEYGKLVMIDKEEYYLLRDSDVWGEIVN